MRTSLIATFAAALLVLAAAPHLATAQPRVAEVKGEKATDEEAAQMLASMRDSARVRYAKDGKAPTTLTQCGVTEDERSGKNCTIRDKVYIKGEQNAAVVSEPLRKDGKYHVLVFQWARGGGQARSFESFDAIKEAYEGFNWDDEVDESKSKHKAGEQWDALYQVGATWVTKVDHGVAIYSKTEVKEVSKGLAVLSVATKFGDKAEYQAPVLIENRRPTKAEAEAPPPGAKLLARGEAKVGDWECDWVEYQIDAKTQRFYTHRKYGLVVKMTEGDKTVIEVTEFKPVE